MPTAARPATIASRSASREGTSSTTSKKTVLTRLVTSSRLSRGAALVEDRRAHVLDVGVDDAEEDELEDRNEERHHQRAAVPQHLDPLLAQDGEESPHRRRSRCGGRGRPALGLELGQAHEDVLERGRDRAHGRPRAWADSSRSRGDPIVGHRGLDEEVERVAEDRDVFDVGKRPRARMRTAAAPPAHSASTRRVPGGRHLAADRQLVRLSDHEELGEVEVGDACRSARPRPCSAW